jgi:DNA-binding response OmpR family regulator
MATLLIIDADRKFSGLLLEVLQRYGHLVHAAATGEEGLRLLAQSVPDAVVLDLGLPGLSSLQTLMGVRAQAPDVPVLAVANEVPVVLENKVRELGVSEVLRKGLKMNLLMEAVQRTLRSVERRGVAPDPGAGPARATPAAPAARILIVDDEPANCDLVEEFLSRRGYRTRIARNGAEALEAIRKEPPGLVLLDIYMPIMNGAEALRRMMAPTFPVQPPPGVIVLTASQDEPLLRECLALGAFDVLMKPLDLRQLDLAVAVKLAMIELA